MKYELPDTDAVRMIGALCDGDGKTIEKFDGYYTLEHHGDGYSSIQSNGEYITVVSDHAEWLAEEVLGLRPKTFEPNRDGAAFPRIYPSVLPSRQNAEAQTADLLEVKYSILDEKTKDKIYEFCVESADALRLKLPDDWCDLLLWDLYVLALACVLIHSGTELRNIMLEIGRGTK